MSMHFGSLISHLVLEYGMVPRTLTIEPDRQAPAKNIDPTNLSTTTALNYNNNDNNDNNNNNNNNNK